jgi:hypothetical protein
MLKTSFFLRNRRLQNNEARYQKGKTLSKKVILWISLLAIPGWIDICQANATEDNFLNAPPTRKKNGSSVKSIIEIHSGFVIFDGRYVPPPYAVKLQRGSVYINGQRVPQKRPGQFSRRPANIYQPNRGPQKRGAAQVERHLRLDGLLICKQSGPTVYVSPDQAISVLEILSDNESGESKVQRLLNKNIRGITSNRWGSLIKTFAGTADLSDRLLAIRQHQAELGEDDTDYEIHWYTNSVLTFSGFILAVWALGTLISCRPPLLTNSRAKVLSKSSCRQVIWLVILIAVLNIYDLVCTLIASSMGSIWELNPFASPIMHQNSEIVLFKLGLTVGAVILLLVTRRNRLAQIGSWWGGVLYTVLILRWSTFNTMFL